VENYNFSSKHSSKKNVAVYIDRSVKQDTLLFYTASLICLQACWNETVSPTTLLNRARLISFRLVGSIHLISP